MKITTKFKVIWLLPVLILIYLSGCASTRVNFDQLISEGYEVRTYEIFGMGCPGCHGGLENLVNKIPGVKTSKANWEKGQLQVVVNPNSEIDDDTIHDAIKRANFTPGKRLS